MLTSQQELRLFGLRYRGIFAGLVVAAAVLIILLLLNFPERNDPLAVAGALTQFREEWSKLLALFGLLGIVATLAIVRVYSYFGTKEKLARVQITAKAILESLVGGVLTLDTAGRVTIINRAAGQLLETSAEPPYPDLDSFSQKHPALVQLVRRALDAHQYVQDQDTTVTNSRNEPLILRTSISEQLDNAGQRVGIVVLVKDVSRLVAMENELRKRDRLAAAGTLAAGVAHEIRNPLSALELNLRLLHDEVVANGVNHDEIEGYFEVLFAETRRLTRITSSFLQLSRPEPLTKAPVSVYQPLLQVMRLLAGEAHEKKISFVLDPAVTDKTVLGDSTKLEQVCLNILINAMQAMPAGGVIRIASNIRGSDGRRFINLSFADQGVGIPSENLPRLFDPYFTTRADGTGLGLAIADRIVTDHGGRIVVESILGSGTMMTVCLPLATGHDAEMELDSRQ